MFTAGSFSLPHSDILPLRPRGRRGWGEVGDSHATALPTSPSRASRRGPLPLPLKGGEGKYWSTAIPRIQSFPQHLVLHAPEGRSYSGGS